MASVKKEIKSNQKPAKMISVDNKNPNLKLVI